MNPEQWLFIIIKYFPVESLILLFRTLIRMLCPERMNIIDQEWTTMNLCHLLLRCDLNRFLCPVLILFFLCFGRFRIIFNNFVCVKNIFFFYVLSFRFTAFFGNINFHRHESTVFIQNFSGPIFISEFQAVFIQIQCDLCTAGFFVPFSHSVF